MLQKNEIWSNLKIKCIDQLSKIWNNLKIKCTYKKIIMNSHSVISRFITYLLFFLQ